MRHPGIRPYYQWGENGKKYYYISGNNRSRKIAKGRAKIQGKAIIINQLK